MRELTVRLPPTADPVSACLPTCPDMSNPQFFQTLPVVRTCLISVAVRWLCVWVGAESGARTVGEMRLSVDADRVCSLSQPVACSSRTLAIRSSFLLCGVIAPAVRSRSSWPCAARSAVLVCARLVAIPQKFQDVPTEGGIDTAKFCEAAEGLVKIFGEFPTSSLSIIGARRGRDGQVMGAWVELSSGGPSPKLVPPQPAHPRPRPIFAPDRAGLGRRPCSLT